MNKKLFDKPIVFQRIFVDLTGSINSALLLSQACYWSQRGKDGWFYKTQKEWQDETGMTRHELDGARKKSEKYLKTKVTGKPSKTYYFVDWDAIESDCMIAENRHSRLPKTGILDCRKPANALYTEITTENTTDISDPVGSQIPLIIKEFEAINVSCKDYYKNKTQRSACEFLIRQFGFEEVKRVIQEDLPKLKSDSYLYATTPYELKEKWVKIKNKVSSVVNNEVVRL